MYSAIFAKNPDNFEEVMKKAKLMANGMSSVKEKILDLTFPIVSYFNGQRFNKMIQRCIGPNTRIQDLLVPFFCVTTDIVDGCQKIHTKGTCWKYLRGEKDKIP